jgi:outer membrane protein OmpA-like peptidoglycan-associated protein
VEGAALPRKEITGLLAAGIVILLGAIFALRFDLASMFLPDAATGPGSKSLVEIKPARMAITAAPAGPAVESDRGVAAPASKFDVVRIDPDGASVFAGRAPANARVTVLANERPVATAEVDENGQWAAVIERPFASGDYQLSLRAKPRESGPETAGQSVRVTIAPGTRPTVSASPATVAAARVSPPAPITFVYDQAAFTDTGRRQMAALAQYLRRQGLNSVTLSGHADSRGSEEYNFELSKQRLEVVARLLREAGYTGKLTLVPMGERQPYATPDRDRLPQEAVYQLDRRVELRSDR